jgi:NAD-dependent SIR2 family protein deacetylase
LAELEENMDWRESIKHIQNAQDNNQLVIFVGAGVSKNSNLPSWNDLIVAIAKEVKHKKCAIPCKGCSAIECNQKKIFTQDEYLQIPEYLYSKGKTKYYKFIQEKLKSDKGPNPIDEEIFRILPHHIITTNYDHLLEDCKDINAKLYTVVSKDSDLLSKSNEKYIIKMHGDLQEPENIVLRESDYIEYEQNRPLISTYIRSLLINHTFVFIGYSLNDYNLKLIMGWINYYSKIYKVKERPYNFLITSNITDSNEKKRLEKQRIYPINLQTIPKEVVEDAKVPSALSYPTAQRLYTYLRCITNIELLYRGMDKLKAILEKLDSLKSYRKIAFDDLCNVLNCCYVDFEAMDMILYDQSWGNFLFDAIENNKEICAFFQKANINRVRCFNSKSFKKIPCSKDHQDKEDNLSLDFNYSQLNDNIDKCSDISKKIYYFCWLDRDKTDIEDLCSQFEKSNSFIDYIDILLFKIRAFFATFSIEDNQYERRNEIKYLLNSVPLKYIKSIKFLKKIFESMSDDIKNMDDLLEKQNERYKVNSNTSFSGHAFSVLWKLQSYAYNYYFFFKTNYIPIDVFLSTKNYFKYYIKAILCTYSPSTEFKYSPRAVFATHREHYPINSYDLDIMVKYCDPKLLKQWIKEYSVQTLEKEKNLNIAEKIKNLSKWCVNVKESKWLKQLECLMIVYNLMEHSDDEENIVFQSVIDLYENIFDLYPMYAAELYEIFYDFVMNYKCNDDYTIYDRFVWLIICSKSSIWIRERFTSKTHSLINKLSKYVSEELKNKVLSYILSIDDKKEKIDRICIAYQMYPCSTFKKIIEDNIDLIEFVDIFNMIMDKYIVLSDNIIKRALDEISNNIKSEVRGVHIQNNSGYYKHLLNYCIIMYLVDLDFDLKLLEKFKDYSDTVCFVLDPNSFDYSKVDLNDYMWYNLIYSNKYQNYFIEHKNEVVSDELKRIFELGIDNREQQKIVYGILLDNNELQKF